MIWDSKQQQGASSFKTLSATCGLQLLLEISHRLTSSLLDVLRELLIQVQNGTQSCKLHVSDMIKLVFSGPPTDLQACKTWYFQVTTLSPPPGTVQWTAACPICPPGEAPEALPTSRNTQVFGCRWYRYSRRSCSLSSIRYSPNPSLSLSIRLSACLPHNPVASCRFEAMCNMSYGWTSLDWWEAQAIQPSCLAIENSWLRLHFKGRTAHDTCSKSAWAKGRYWATLCQRRKVFAKVTFFWLILVASSIILLFMAFAAKQAQYASSCGAKHMTYSIWMSDCNWTWRVPL